MSRALDTAHAAQQRTALAARPPVTEGVSLCSAVTPAALDETTALVAYARARHAARPGMKLMITLHVREDSAP